MPRQLKVGLTGGIGCGKSTVLKHFRTLGCAYLDDDATVHKLYAPGGAATGPISQLFPEVMDESGGVSRPKLSRLIQSAKDPSQVLKEVEKIVHPLVGEHNKAFLEGEARQSWIVILDIPLLLEGLRARGVTRGRGEGLSGFDFDAIVVVTCPREVQRARCLARPEMTTEKLNFILEKQMSPEDRLPYADFVIDSGIEGLDETSSIIAGKAQASDVVAKLLSRYGGPPSVLASPLPPPRQGFVTCVTFDLDDTLFRISRPLVKAITASLDLLQASCPKIVAKAAAAGRTMREEMMSYQKEVRQKYPLLSHDLTEMRRLAIIQLAQSAGESDPHSIAKSCVEAFLKERGAVEEDLYDDTLAVLETLKRSGFRLGSITNGNADIGKFAPRLQALLDFEITPIVAGASKPKPTPFLAAACAAGVSSLRNIVHVGDSARSDVWGAKEVGMGAVLLERNDPPSEDPAVKAFFQAGNVQREQINPALPWRADGENKTAAEHAAKRADARISSLWELPKLLEAWSERPLASNL